MIIFPPTPEQLAENRHSATTVAELALYLRAQAQHDRACARAAAELGREHRQEQQDELHNFRIATAEIRAGREMHRFIKENPGANSFGSAENAA